MKVQWTVFKSFVISRSLSIQWIEDAKFYYMKAFDGAFFLDCDIDKNPSDSTELDDFEINFKAKGNKKLIVSSIPFGSKVLPDGSKLFRRVRGTSSSVQNLPDNIDFIVPFTKCKITGLQILNAKLGDKATFQILDTAEGTISGYPYVVLNTFGQDVYITPDIAHYPSKYDADLIAGLTLRIIYDAVDELLPRTIYVNFDLHEVIAP